jgi:hypothetical protein
VVEYIKERYPEVGRKMSLLQLGLFVTNWKWGQGAVPWEKVCFLSYKVYQETSSSSFGGMRMKGGHWLTS